MAINRGKQFEEKLKEQFEKVEDTLVLRLYDVTTGYKNQNNICDFIVFRNGTLNLFECKAVHGNTLNFKSHIKQNQWDGLLENSTIPAVNAGIIVWFIDRDETYFIDIEYLDYLKTELNQKSFNPKTDLEKIPTSLITGKKKRVFFEYDLKSFLEEIEYE